MLPTILQTPSTFCHSSGDGTSWKSIIFSEENSPIARNFRPCCRSKILWFHHKGNDFTEEDNPWTLLMISIILPNASCTISLTISPQEYTRNPQNSWPLKQSSFVFLGMIYHILSHTAITISHTNVEILSLIPQSSSDLKMPQSWQETSSDKSSSSHGSKTQRK